MTTPVTTPRIGQLGTQPGLFELGAAVGALNPPIAKATIPATATAFIGHVYNNARTTLKATLTILNRPKLKWSLNGGYDSITINTSTDITATVSLGDIVQLSEQDGDGSTLYSGIVEQTINTYDNPAVFGLVLTPLVAELGDTGFSTNYVNATDIAQMVRDAVSSTIHLKFNNYTIPDTGQTAVYDFATTNCLDVLNIARLMAGTNYWWFVDASGYVWFQPMGGLAQYSLYQMQQFTSLTKQPDITKLKNSFTVIGGIPSGSTSAITATYTGASTATYGPRTIMPPPTFPTVASTAVLASLANTIGGVLDRIINRIDIGVNNYTTPIVPNQPGGPMVRYWEPVNYPTQQASTGAGGYSANFIALENERDGPLQTIQVGDIPVTGVDDLKYMLDNIVNRWVVNASSVNPTVVQPAAGGVITTAGGSTTVADSTGILSSAVMTQPSASIHGGNPGAIYSNVTTPTLLLDGNGKADAINIQATRATQWLIIGAVQVVGPTVGSQTFGCQIYVDGVLPSDAPSFTWNGAGTAANVTLSLHYVATVGAGSHTFAVLLTTGTSTNYTVTTFDLYAFLLGS